MYPKVKVRQEPFPEVDDDADLRHLGLKALLSLSLHASPSPSPASDPKVVSTPSIVKVPKCYVPRVFVPRVPVTEDFGDYSLTPDSPRSTGTEKDFNTDENRVNIRASLIPRPRAVISSPDNDTMIGSRNKIRDGRNSSSKNGSVSQNRHAHCQVKSHAVTDIPPDTRKCKEPGSKEKVDPLAKKKGHKGRKKSENVPREEWKF